MKNKVVMDIEVYPNYFLLGYRDYITGEGNTLEIHKNVNQLDDIVKWCRNFKGFMITFNGIHYDQVILAYICLEYHTLKYLTNDQICEKIKSFSDNIIFDAFIDRKYKYFFKWTSVDLYLYWSKMLRLSKKISLKSLGIQINYPVVQELPHPPDMWLNIKEIGEVRDYNYIHDLGILEKLLVHPIKWQGKPTTFEKQIKLRANICREYKLPKDIFSWDAPKIATELLLDFRVNEEGGNKWDIKREEYIEGSRLPLPDLKFKLPQFKELYKEMCVADRSFKKTILLNHKNTSIRIDYGVGGVHSHNKNEMYESTEKELVYTSDVGSLYPNLILNYKAIRQPVVLKQYGKIKDERMIAKRTGDKNKNVTFKLILNSTSGLLDSKYSWLYYPEGAMKMRLMGQLIMTKTVEELVLKGFKVVSINTDGCECIVRKEREQEYLSIVNNVGKSLDLEFEHEVYSKIVYSNINNYVAVGADGSLKQKGRTFITEPNLGDSCNHLIIPKALIEYFTKGTKPEEFIKECTNIFDFCISMKSSKKFTVYWNNQKQQRLNRFFVSKSGKYIYKSEDGKKMKNMLKGWAVQLYNNHIEQDISNYNIDYSFYISQTRKWISEIERHNQLTLF